MRLYTEFDDRTLPRLSHHPTHYCHTTCQHAACTPIQVREDREVMLVDLQLARIYWYLRSLFPRLTLSHARLRPVRCVMRVVCWVMQGRLQLAVMMALLPSARPYACGVCRWPFAKRGPYVVGFYARKPRPCRQKATTNSQQVTTNSPKSRTSHHGHREVATHVTAVTEKSRSKMNNIFRRFESSGRDYFGCLVAFFG